MASVFFIPYFMNILGAEAYGLVGFFGSLQVALSLLDMGLASVILRETSCYLGGIKNKKDASTFYSFCKVLNYLFILIGCTIFLCLMCLNSYFSHSWFNYVVLTPEDVSFCLMIMAFFIVCKWMSGFYKAVVSGAENFKVITYVNVIVTTIRYISVIPVFIFYKADVKIFFIIQIVAVLFETIILYYHYRQHLPTEIAFDSRLGLLRLKSLLSFSSYAWIISLLYIILTQVDKIYFSKTLSLDVFGLFSFAIVLATLINLCAAPIQHALQPRLVFLFSVSSAAQFYKCFRSIYFVSTSLILFITGSVFLSIKAILVLLSYSIKDIEIILNVSQLYLVGNALFSIASMSYFMQYSLGNLKYHLIGQGILCAFFCVGVLTFGQEYKYLATGFLWVILNIMYILLWIPFVNSRLLPEYKVKSYIFDLTYLVMIPFGVILIIHYFIDFEYSDSTTSIVAKWILSCTIFVVLFLVFYKKTIFTHFEKIREI